jgi:hypothetical protein
MTINEIIDRLYSEEEILEIEYGNIAAQLDQETAEIALRINHMEELLESVGC